MKKLLTIMLALVMVLSLSVTALAAGNSIDQGSTNKTGNTTVTFNVDPTYTVTIPATVELEKKTAADETVTYEKDLTVSAENVRLLEGKQIQVTLTSDFTLTNDTQNGGAATNLSYTVTVGDSATPIVTDGVVATFGTSTTEQTMVARMARFWVLTPILRMRMLTMAAATPVLRSTMPKPEPSMMIKPTRARKEPMDS